MNNKSVHVTSFQINAVILDHAIFFTLYLTVKCTTNPFYMMRFVVKINAGSRWKPNLQDFGDIHAIFTRHNIVWPPDEEFFSKNRLSSYYYSAKHKSHNGPIIIDTFVTVHINLRTNNNNINITTQRKLVCLKKCRFYIFRPNKYHISQAPICCSHPPTHVKYSPWVYMDICFTVCTMNCQYLPSHNVDEGYIQMLYYIQPNPMYLALFGQYYTTLVATVAPNIKRAYMAS